MGFGNQLGMFHPVVGLTEFGEFVRGRDNHIVGNRDSPLLHQSHSGTFKHLGHDVTPPTRSGNGR